MYFNKTRCSMAFDLVLVDLKLPTSLTLTPVTALDAEAVFFSLRRRIKEDTYLHMDT